MANSLELFGEDELINMELLQDALKTYYISTGIKVFAIDDKGDMIASCGKGEGICEFLKISTNQKCGCSKSHLYASKQSEIIGEGYIFFCPAGLVHYTAPIVKNKVFKGAIVAGPILMDYPDSMIVDDIIQNNNLSIDNKGRIFSLLRAVPVVEPSRVGFLSKLLFTVAFNLMGEEKELLHERNEKMLQQSKIGESIHAIKEKTPTKNDYPYEKEKELLIKVKNGDVIGAKEALNELLGYVFFTGGSKLEVIKARTLELCTLLSRAAVEGGGALDEIFGMNYEFISELSEIEDIEELSYWTLKVLDRFMENVFILSYSKNGELIRRAINYVNDNFMEEMTLESVANYVHLNSSYFSTLFKKETGMKFSDYLNKVRIEESKKMLKNIKFSILEIALEVGFEDQSYYSKVFKKTTGITPKQYRKNRM